MRDDLLDAYAAVDWAVAYLPTLKKTFEAWINSPPYLLVEEAHPEMGKKLFKLEINRPMSPKLNAAVGAVVNSIRTSLDLLATSLAVRNGKAADANRHFPIYRSVDGFNNPQSVEKRKRWLTSGDLAIIESLNPYRGGNDPLWALHHLDITRKHERLIKADLSPTGVTISPEAHAQGFGFPSMWPGFKDGAVIGWTNINATNSDFEVTAGISFRETELGLTEPVICTLRQFASLADAIIQRFE